MEISGFRVVNFLGHRDLMAQSGLIYGMVYPIKTLNPKPYTLYPRNLNPITQAVIQRFQGREIILTSPISQGNKGLDFQVTTKF